MSKHVFISGNAYKELNKELQNTYHVISIPEIHTLYDGIRDHADIHIHVIGSKVIVSREIVVYIEDTLLIESINYTLADNDLGGKYPDTAILNGLSTGKSFIHNTAITDAKLLDCVKELGLDIINVKQGYVRCTTLPLNDNTFITSDLGIYKKLKDQFDITLIQQGHIVLPCHDYGFIGGTAGRIGDTIYFNGDISLHPDYLLIKNKIESLGLKIRCVEGKPLVDIGSILTLDA